MHRVQITESTDKNLENLLSRNGRNKIAHSPAVSVFAEIDSLPGSQIEPTLPYGNGKTRPENARFKMSWHIIGSLHRVSIDRKIFGNGTGEIGFEIPPDGGIGVFIDGQ